MAMGPSLDAAKEVADYNSPHNRCDEQDGHYHVPTRGRSCRRRCTFLTALFAWTLCLLLLCAKPFWSEAWWWPSSQPQQVHLAFGRTEDSISVAWVTQSGSQGQVQWGESETSLDFHADGDSRKFKLDRFRIWYTHVAVMTGLKPNTTYFYRVIVDNHSTTTYPFVHRRSGAPYKHVLFGDLGASCAFSLCSACTSDTEVCDASVCARNTSAGLVSEVGKADMFLHLGDFGYDLDTNNGKTGDHFMQNIEQLAAKMPYMVNHGNHENGAQSLAHYMERFRSQPSNAEPATFATANGETTNVLYFSWDYGLVHYVTIPTELWFGISDGKTTKQTFLEWLKRDLQAANNNRENVPWIIVQGHRSIYCSCDGDCDGDAEAVRADMEEVLMEHGVDFFINAHEHNYERSFPLYKGKSKASLVNPTAPIYIVSGSAGNREMHEPFTQDQPSWSAFRSNTFGYTILWVHNATHVHGQQVSTDPTSFPMSRYGEVIDDFWVVQKVHGPFDRALAPQGEAFPPGGDAAGLRARSLDHWLPLLGFDHRGAMAGEEYLRWLQTKDGRDAWQERLGNLQQWVHEHLGPEMTLRRKKKDNAGDVSTKSSELDGNMFTVY